MLLRLSPAPRIVPAPEDGMTDTPRCRYHFSGCDAAATHHCEQCGRDYCAAHAERHNRVVLEEFSPINAGGPDPKHAILAWPMADTIKHLN